MITNAELQRIKASLWSQDAVRPEKIFGIFDCARHPDLFDLVSRTYRERGCLFAGDLQPVLERAAPMLLELQPRDGLTDELLRRGWNDAWCTLLEADCNFASLRRHLRKLLRVRTVDGRLLLFRYYDPRVLRAYFPTCTADELDTMYRDAVVRFVLPSECAGELESYRLEDSVLRVEAHGSLRAG